MKRKYIKYIYTHKFKYIYIYIYSYREGTQEVAQEVGSKCTRGRPCQSVLP